MSTNKNRQEKETRDKKEAQKYMHGRFMKQIMDPYSFNRRDVTEILDEWDETYFRLADEIVDYQEETEGMTPLMITIRYGIYASAQYLLDIHANIQLVDNHGINALMYAISRYDREVFDEENKRIVKNIIHRIIDEQGYIVDKGDKDGTTELMYAIKAKLPIDLIQKFLANGSKTTTQNKEGNTPLMIAVSIYDQTKDYITELVRRLIEPDPSIIDVQNKEGQTALMLAIKNAGTYAINALLPYHPNMTIRDSNGDTALKIAGKLRLINIFDILLPYYSDESIKNNAISAADLMIYRKYAKKTPFVITPETIQIGLPKDNTLIKIPEIYSTRIVKIDDIQNALEGNSHFEYICDPINPDYLHESSMDAKLIIMCSAGTEAQTAGIQEREIIGIVLAKIKDTNSSNIVLFISAICTNPKYSTVGTQLMNIVKNICKVSGIHKIKLEPIGREVVNFYTKQKFVMNESNTSGRSMKHNIHAEGGRRRKTRKQIKKTQKTKKRSVNSR